MSAAGQLPADVFICITPGPLAVLQRAGLVRRVIPIASTRMAVIYSPRSRYAPARLALSDGTELHAQPRD